MEAIQDAVLAAVASPLVYVLLFAVVVIDGFFPPVPSETTVVAAAAIGVATGSPNPIIVGIIAAIGATLGDSIAYLIGRYIGIERFAWMRRPRVARAIERTRIGLARRAPILILTARYVPVGRVAVNMTAGATRLPARRFVPLALLAGVCWSAYSIGIGLLAGAWAHEHPLLGALIGIAIAISIGILVELVSAVLRRRAARRQPSPQQITTERTAHQDVLLTAADALGTASTVRAPRAVGTAGTVSAESAPPIH